MGGDPQRSLIGRAVVRLRLLIVIAWLAATYAAVDNLPTIREAQTGALGDLVPADARAAAAERRSAELFAFPLLSRTVVVHRDPEGLPLEAQSQIVDRALSASRGTLPGFERVAGALPVTNAVGAPPFARETSTTALTFLFFEPDIRARVRLRLAEAYVESHAEPLTDGFVGVTGAVAGREQQADIIEERLPLVEAATLFLVIAATALHFRSLGAPLITIMAVAVAYLLSVRVIAVLGRELGVSVPSEVEPVMVVLLFGIITDYSIFYLSRARSALGEGTSPARAAIRTVGELSPVILTAGLTVAGATAALVVAELGFFRAFGPGTALAVLIGLAVALTFIPACLAIGGRAVFWPSLPDRSGGDVPRLEPDRARGVEIAIRHPRLVIAAVGAVLLICASGLTETRVGNAIVRGLPEEAPAHQAYIQAATGFAAGVVAPTVLLLEGDGITGRREELRDLQARVAAMPGVAQVIGPAQIPVGENLGVVYSPTGDAARMLVVLDADPLEARAIGVLRRLRDRLPEMLAESGLPQVRAGLAGDTALSEEVVTRAGDDLTRIALAALVVVVGILVVFLRALVAPLYLVAASVLALAASLGIATYVFQEIIGHAGLTYYVPFAAAVLLVALGSDYNVFLTGRIWQEARMRPLRAAVSVGSARATRAITVAAIVLALSFAMLGLVPVRGFQELAFVMAAGLMIDAFLVRTLLVPALIILFGERSRWPGRFPVLPPALVPSAGPPAQVSTDTPIRGEKPPSAFNGPGSAPRWVGPLILAASVLQAVARGRRR